MVGWRIHLPCDALPRGRIFKALDPLLQSPFLDPRRHRGVQPRPRSGVSVHVRRDVQPLSSGDFYFFKQPVELVPIRLPRGFEMVKLGTYFSFTGYANEFVRRFQQAVALAANVRDVQAVVFSRYLAQRNQFIGPGVEGGRVNKRGADAEGALFHRLAHKLLHALQFFRRRRAIGITDFVHTHGRRAHERCDIAGDAAPDEVIEIFTERSPGDIEFDVSLLLAHLLFHLLIERPHRFALAENLEGDALANVTLRAAIFDERLGGPAQHIDEARRDGQAGGINF